MRLKGLAGATLVVARLGLFYDYDFGAFIFQIKSYGFQVCINLALHAFIHGFAFDGGVLPFKFFNFFLQQLNPAHASFGIMCIGDVENAQPAQKEQELKVAKYQIGGVATYIECIQ
jgi:hypothetical protein